MTTPWTAPSNWSRPMRLRCDEPRACIRCGCTDDDCTGCIERTGRPCYWIKENLCSACVDAAEMELAA